MYLIVAVLINLVSLSLFFRGDLTENKIYSLSKESQNVVKQLSEPLTVKVFFTKNLPAPYNNVERYLRDLLEEYGAIGGKLFNYKFYNVSADEKQTVKNRELARSYGIHPVQIQDIEKDQVKFQNAYMGMVIINGDVMETIPAITDTEMLEYKITSTIRKMNNKISKLLQLNGKVKVNVLISSSLSNVLEGVDKLYDSVDKTVEKINENNFDKVMLVKLDPSKDEKAKKLAKDNNVIKLQWKKDKRSNSIEEGFAGLLVSYNDKSVTIQLIEQVRTLFGVQYKLTSEEELEKTIENAVEKVININTEIGYLTSNGTLSPGLPFSFPGQQPNENEIKNLNKLLSKDYTVKSINLKEDKIPESLDFLIIPGAKENFSDYELFQIDQFLMRGGSLAVFEDPFKEITMQNKNRMMFQNQGPLYLPLNTGLDKLLSHYGITVKKAYVFDKNCFKQRIPQAFGGGEKEIFFAPIIKNKNINKNLTFMKNIKGLVMLKCAPLDIDKETTKKLKVYPLFSSSAKSWEMKGKVNLNPMFLTVPTDEKQFKQYPLAYLFEGEFASYFADKDIPVKEEKEKQDGEKVSSSPKKNTKTLEATGGVIKKGVGKLFVIGSSEILKDNVIDEEGKGPNAQFILNVIDYLNGREQNAVMRSKSQKLNPLKEVSPSVRTFTKIFNIAGLPVLVALLGLIVWFQRMAKKKSIKAIFTK
jgi:ABC-type uncharacterized transport system involved in gliding motility auxiliary subunit